MKWWRGGGDEKSDRGRFERKGSERRVNVYVCLRGWREGKRREEKRGEWQGVKIKRGVHQQEKRERGEREGETQNEG